MAKEMTEAVFRSMFLVVSGHLEFSLVHGVAPGLPSGFMPQTAEDLQKSCHDNGTRLSKE